MSVSFTKLFSSITESTVWAEPDHTRIVWITMMAMADHAGRVWASIPGLANRARVQIDKCEEALNTFLSPDKYSRTTDFDGRRIEPIDGGWRLLNHAKYKAIRDHESIKESKRKSIAARRAKEKESKELSTVDRGRHNAEADTEAEAENQKHSSISFADDASGCPHKQIIEAYHRILPTLPRVRQWTPARQQALRTRWREDEARQDIGWWEKLFEYVKASDFLMGRVSGFQCSLEWLLKAKNFVKVIEGNYENRETQA